MAGFDEAEIEFTGDDEELNVLELEKASEDAPVVRLVNMILLNAIKKGASDIHIEPYEKKLRVRYRIDGVLIEEMTPPLKLKNAIASRLKIMSSLDIAERRLPQDGRIKLKLGKGREMDFRVSVLPTLWGEKIVMRLLDKGEPAARHDEARLRSEAARRLPVGDPPAVGHGARHGPDRLGQDDDALLGAQRAQQDRRTTSAPRKIRSSTTCTASTRCRCTTRSA